MNKSMMVAMTLAILAVAAIAPQAARAQDAGASFKAGVVDVATLLKDSKKRIQQYDALKVEADAQQKEMDAAKAAIEKNKGRFDLEGAKMSQEERVALRDKIDADFEQWKNEMSSRARKLKSREADIVAAVMKDISAAVAKIASEKGYHLVLNSSMSGTTSSPLQYFAPSIDITPAVIAELNK